MQQKYGVKYWRSVLVCSDFLWFSITLLLTCDVWHHTTSMWHWLACIFRWGPLSLWCVLGSLYCCFATWSLWIDVMSIRFDVMWCCRLASLCLVSLWCNIFCLCDAQRYKYLFLLGYLILTKFHGNFSSILTGVRNWKKIAAFKECKSKKDWSLSNCTCNGRIELVHSYHK